MTRRLWLFLPLTACALGIVALPILVEAGPLFQPNNAPIPAGNSLQTQGFDALNEPINAVLDAEVMPDVFIPSCSVSFTVYLRNAGYQNSFGWYNANGVPPGLDDLHQILDCDEPVNTMKMVDIRDDPDYEGGEIGFFEAVGGCADVNNPPSVQYVFHSETEWNPDSMQNNPYIHLLIYESINFPRTYYFAWEDLLQGGDNDFEDLFTSVAGVDCVNGPPCDIVAVPGDLDVDFACDPDDNCPNLNNPNQADADMDGLGDPCDPCPNDVQNMCGMGDGDGDGDTNGDGDGDTNGDGDGDTNGDGDGDTNGDGDGDTNGDGDGDTNGDGDGDTNGDGDGDTNGDGDGDPGDGDPDESGDTFEEGTDGEGDAEGNSGSGEDTGDEFGDDGTAETGGTGDTLGGDVLLDDGCNCSTDRRSHGPGFLLSVLLGLAAIGRRRRHR